MIDGNYLINELKRISSKPTPLEALKILNGYACNNLEYLEYNDDLYPIIENALKEYEKLSKEYSRVVEEKLSVISEYGKKVYAFEIIKKKEVEIGLLKGILHADKSLHTASYYNSHFVATYKHLTQEEYDLLKGVL